MKKKNSKAKKKTASSRKVTSKSTPPVLSAAQRDTQLEPSAVQKKSPQLTNGIEGRIQSGVAYVGNSVETIGKRISRAASYKRT